MRSCTPGLILPGYGDQLIVHACCSEGCVRLSAHEPRPSECTFLVPRGRSQ